MTRYMISIGSFASWAIEQREGALSLLLIRSLSLVRAPEPL